MGEEKTDAILTMFEKFQSSYLTEEGLAILKSMADSIRSALEKGTLLEQMLIDQKLKKTAKTNTSKKKKKKKKSYDEGLSDNLVNDDKVLTEDADIASSCPNDLPPDDSSTCELGNSTMETEFQETKPNLIALNDMPTPLLESKIKLVDQSLLLKHSVNANQIENESMLRNRYQCATCSHIRPSNSPNIDNVQRVNNSFHMNNQFSNSANPLINSMSPELNNPALLTPKQNPVSPVENVTPVNSSLTNDPNVPTNLQSPQQNVYNQPVMPCPIFIKSEPKSIEDNSPNSFIPLDIKLNINTNDEHPKETTGNDNSPKSVPHPTSEPEQNEEIPVNRSSPERKEHKVYIEAGHAATEADVMNMFTNLDVTSCRVLKKPTHSYGFVTFSSEEHMMEALKLSNRFSVGGNIFVIRHCYKQRNWNKEQPAIYKRFIGSLGSRPANRGRFSNDSDRLKEDTPTHSRDRSKEDTPTHSRDRSKEDTPTHSRDRLKDDTSTHSRDMESRSPSNSRYDHFKRSSCDRDQMNESHGNRHDREPHSTKNGKSRPKIANRSRPYNNFRQSDRNWSDRNRGRPGSANYKDFRRSTKPNLGARNKR